MRIKTKEYCEKCPWFDHNLGYIEASEPYWQQHENGCACEHCPSREECEANGPKDIRSCLALELRRRGLRPRSVMNKQDLPKCLYCDFRSSDREEQKKHLREKHHTKMVEIARKGNQTIEYAVGLTASYFTYASEQGAGR